MVPLDGHIPVKRNFQGEMLRIGPMCRYAEDLPLLLKVQFTFWNKNCKNKISRLMKIFLDFMLQTKFSLYFEWKVDLPF